MERVFADAKERHCLRYINYFSSSFAFIDEI